MEQEGLPPDENEEEEEEFFWHFADFGHNNVVVVHDSGQQQPQQPQQRRQLSRDGSIHATDEVFNSISHMAAFFLSTLGSAVLVSEASSLGAPWKIVAFALYGSGLCLLFGASTLHHAISTTKKWERYFRLLDYLSIFPLIAGTFTPLCLVYLHSTVLGWCFLAVVYTLSGLCMSLLCKEFDKVPKWMTMTMYLSLGWFGGLLLLCIYPTYLPIGGAALMVGGGVFYSVGGYIYSSERPNPIPGHFGFHELWHIFVILGAATHWMMMYLYVLPYDQHDQQQ